MDAPKRDFRHYMTRFGAIFPLKSGLGSKFPWDGSAIPWDGNRNPWDGSTVQPHGSTKTTLKGGRRSLSALTLCHIAHSASPAERCPPRRDAIRRVSHRPDGLGGAAFLPPTARGAAPPRHSFPSQWPIRLCARHESRPSSPLRGVSVAFGRGAGRAIFANRACQIENTALINCKIRGG